MLSRVPLEIEVVVCTLKLFTSDVEAMVVHPEIALLLGPGSGRKSASGSQVPNLYSQYMHTTEYCTRVFCLVLIQV